MFIEGGTTGEKPEKFQAQYRLFGCLRPNKTLLLTPLAQKRYFLTDHAFYEIENNGSGIKITNQWKDAAGRYFFTWVKNGGGFLYFIPNDPTKHNLLLRYANHSYKVKKMQGAMQPVGKLPEVCVLKKL